MKKKIIFCSVGAVVLIVLAGFASVVGIQTAESEIKDSPLFKIRTDGAIKSNYKLPKTTQYLANEKILFLNSRLSKNEMITQEFLEKMNSMSEKQFENFINSIIQKIVQNNIIENEQLPGVINALNFLKKDSKQGLQVLINSNTEEDEILYTPGNIYCTVDCPSTGPIWVCLLVSFIYVLLMPIWIIIIIITLLKDLKTAFVWCP